MAIHRTEIYRKYYNNDNNVFCFFLTSIGMSTRANCSLNSGEEPDSRPTMASPDMAMLHSSGRFSLRDSMKGWPCNSHGRSLPQNTRETRGTRHDVYMEENLIVNTL